MSAPPSRTAACCAEVRGGTAQKYSNDPSPVVEEPSGSPSASKTSRKRFQASRYRSRNAKTLSLVNTPTRAWKRRHSSEVGRLYCSSRRVAFLAISPIYGHHLDVHFRSLLTYPALAIKPALVQYARRGDAKPIPAAIRATSPTVRLKPASRLRRSRCLCSSS